VYHLGLGTVQGSLDIALGIPALGIPGTVQVVVLSVDHIGLDSAAGRRCMQAGARTAFHWRDI